MILRIGNDITFIGAVFLYVRVVSNLTKVSTIKLIRVFDRDLIT